MSAPYGRHYGLALVSVSLDALIRMAHKTRETLLVSLSAPEAEQALDDVLIERGFERAGLRPPRPPDSIARSDARFFDVDLLPPSLSIIREWAGYSDATAWGAALELAEGLPPAARMEMALPPALSVLARAISRRATVLGFAVREKPSHFVSVVFRQGRAMDVFTAVKDRVVTGPHGQAFPSTAEEARTHLHRWLTSYGVSTNAIEVVLGERDLPSAWRLAYLHS
jgi:hypothetical protein